MLLYTLKDLTQVTQKFLDQLDLEYYVEIYDNTGHDLFKIICTDLLNFIRLQELPNEKICKLKNKISHLKTQLRQLEQAQSIVLK